MTKYKAFMATMSAQDQASEEAYLKATGQKATCNG